MGSRRNSFSSSYGLPGGQRNRNVPGDVTMPPGRVLRPLETPRMPLAAPPRENRFGSPLELLRVHWVLPEVGVEVTYLTWTEGGLLRAVSYQEHRMAKP